MLLHYQELYPEHHFLDAFLGGTHSALDVFNAGISVKNGSPRGY